MRRLVSTLALVSVPVLLMLQVLQGYRYEMGLQEMARMENEVETRLEDNGRIVTGIAVFDAPARIHRVAEEALELSSPSPGDVLQVRLPESGGDGS